MDNEKNALNGVNDSLENLPEKLLEEVNGGFGIITYKPHPYVITQNNSRYSSGDTPKYQLGQRVKIKCTCEGVEYMLFCEIISVSESATAGWICKEFSYSVKITDIYFDHTYNCIYNDVYESCLYEC